MQEEIDIRLDDLTNPEIFRFLKDHLEDMAQHSPPESVHALDLDGLRQPDVTFWSIWLDTELVGCGAIKELDSRHAEIKSMRTDPLYVRKGIASALMRFIVAEAQRRNYKRLSLETGSMEAFEPARSFYARFGFDYCGPFGDYIEDPYSVFMTREI